MTELQTNLPTAKSKETHDEKATQEPQLVSTSDHYQQQQEHKVTLSVEATNSSAPLERAFDLWRQHVAFDEARAAEEALIRLTLNVNDRGIPLPRAGSHKGRGESPRIPTAESAPLYDWEPSDNNREHPTTSRGNDEGDRNVASCLDDDEENAVESTTVELIQSQLTSHPELVHQVTTHGRITALIAAVWVGSQRLLRLFLERGAKIDASDVQERTALWWAARLRRTVLARLLLEHGANPRLVDSAQLHTPCHVAAAYQAVGVLQTL